MPDFVFDQESKDQYPEDNHDEEVVLSPAKNIETPDSPGELELMNMGKSSEFDLIEETADSEEINLLGGNN